MSGAEGPGAATIFRGSSRALLRNSGRRLAAGEPRLPPPGSRFVLGQWAQLTDGPTEITVQAVEPQELKPYEGGAEVIISIEVISGTSVSYSRIASGETDSSGVFVWIGNAPSPNKDQTFKVDVSVAGLSPSVYFFRARTPRAMAAGPGHVSKKLIEYVACLPGTDPLVCAVARAQVDWKEGLAMAVEAWGSPEFEISQEIAVRHVKLRHPKLTAHWETYSWWVGDLGIPPKDWPELVERVDQVSRIFLSIPFPRWQAIEDLFLRCARGIPIAKGRAGENFNIANPRFYSDTWSDYFPRADSTIEKDMAVAYCKLAPIIRCMIHKIKQKTKEMERTLKTMAVLSFTTAIIFSPFLIASGASGVAVLATEAYDFVGAMQGQLEAAGITAALAVALIAAGNTDLVLAALEPLVGAALEDMDPLAAQAIEAIYPQVISSVMEGVGIGGIGVGAADLTPGQEVGGIVVALVIKMLISIGKVYAAKHFENFSDAAASTYQAGVDLTAAIHPCLQPEIPASLRAFCDWLWSKINILEVVLGDAIDQMVQQFLDAVQAGLSQGGSIAVVPETGGGGLTVVSTDPGGTPTGADGQPLPGGMAPLTDPEPQGSATTLETAVGVGGLAAVLLVGSQVL